MRKRRALVVGDSHTQAVKDALRNRETRGGDSAFAFEAYRYAKDKDGRTIGDLGSEELLALVASLAADDVVVSTIGGNQHQLIAAVQHPVAFDVFAPGEPALASSGMAVVIPSAQLNDHLESDLRAKDGLRLQKIREAAACRVCHAVPPPPKEDAGHMLRRHGPALAKAGILQHGVSPAPLRLKIWRMQVGVLRQLAKEWGITLLPPPEGAVCPKGFLAPACYADDATHANAAYGELMLRQLEQIVRQQAG